MDAFSGRREINKAMAPKGGCNNMASKSLLREENDQNPPQFCNRIGCSGRIKYSQNKRNPNLDISSKKPSSTSLQSSLGSKVSANSSSSSSVITSSKNPHTEGKKKSPFKRQSDLSSEISLSSESEASELGSASIGYHSKSKKNSGNFIVASEASSSSGSSNPRRVSYRKTTVNNRNTRLASSVSGRRTSLGPENGGTGNSYGLRNLNCSSTSDLLRPNSSSSDSNTSGKNTMRKRRQESEISGKSSIASSSSSSVVNGHVSNFSSVDRNRSWTRRSAANVNPRTGIVRNNEPIIRDSHVPGISDNLIPFRVGGRSSSRPLTSNISSNSSAYHGHDSLRRYNMNNIAAEVLFALEMIEQDEELTHEQVRVLEASLLLSGLNLNDQHRDMRLDIDNMSYEELLALEERMGTVSTALSEEEISKCLEKGSYEQPPPFDDHGDHAKCSICQEEYEVGDEMGTMVECKHGFHVSCVRQWLRLKNWCPVCKASAFSSSSSKLQS